MKLTAEEARQLSKLLFEAREQLSMWADVVAWRAERRDTYTDGLVVRIDELRAEHGWSPHGFGHEEGTQ